MQQQTATADFRTLAIDQLRESPTNPRRSFSEAKLQELEQSIRAQGILVPLIVRKTEPQTFEVVAGARRFRAAQRAELFALPVRIVELTDSEAITLQLVENAIREDVHPYEEAMAYKSLLEAAEPRYDVASISLKTGRSVTHIYGRLRMAELIPEAAEVFQANQITAGHAVLIARLPQEQQKEALKAAFREDWRSKEKQAVSVRELAQWIRDTLMLTLGDAVFDREDPNLFPPAGACVTCATRTGANTALFDDFFQDDRCLLASCFHQKVENHIAREKQKNQGLIQITRAYYTQTKGEEPTLTRGEYTVVEPEQIDQAGTQNTSPCSTATSAIVVEGPGKRGEIIQVCADSTCAVHGKPNHRAEQENITRQRQEEWQARQQERAANQEKNRQLLDSVLGQIPEVLKRADFETLLFAVVERLESDDWEAIAERYKIDTDDFQEPDAAAFELRKKAESATDSQLVSMLFELALLPFGYSEEPLEFTNPLASAARRYESLLTAKRTTKVKGAQCSPQAGKAAKPSKRKAKMGRGSRAPVNKVTQKRGAA